MDIHKAVNPYPELFRFKAAEHALQAISDSNDYYVLNKSIFEPVRTTEVLSLRPSEVPEYLQNSVFYKALDVENDDAFEVPASYFKSNLEITSLVQLDDLLNTLHYWGCETIFTEVLHYIYNVLEQKHFHDICGVYAQRSRYIAALSALRPYYYGSPQTGPYFHVLNKALSYGILEILVFLRKQGHTFNQESVMCGIKSRSVACLRYVIEEGFTWQNLEEKIFARKLTTHVNPTTDDIAMIKYCISNAFTDVLTSEACTIAAVLGDVDLLRQLHELRCPWDSNVCAKAAGAGHMPCLVYLHESGAPWDEETCVAAATGKHMECLTYAVEQGCPADERVSNIAIANDDLEMLMFAHENLLPWEDDMCMLAALKGSLRCLRYVHEAGCALTQETSAAAANHRDMACLVYAHENGAPWNVATCINASKIYNLPALEYAASRGCPVDLSVSLHALKMNCAPIFIQFMLEHNFPLHPELCRMSARCFNPLQLRFLHEGGCPWTATTTRDASRCGNLEALQYAAERGCPVQVVPCSCSVGPEHFECMKYVYDNFDNTFNPIPAIIHDHHKCYQHAYKNGCEWTEAAVVCAARLGKLAFLQFAFSTPQCPYYKYIDKVYAAVEDNGHTECVVYLDQLKLQKLVEFQFRLKFHAHVRRLAVRARQQNASRAQQVSVNRFIVNYLHAVLVETNILSFCGNYCVKYDSDELDGIVWKRSILTLQQKGAKLENAEFHAVIKCICQILRSSETLYCVGHLLRVITILKQNALNLKRCRHNIHNARVMRRVQGRATMRKCVVSNPWTRIMCDSRNFWTTYAAVTMRKYKNNVLAL